LRVLSFSSCFPSSVDAFSGVFVLRRLRALAELVPLEVVHPIAHFPGYQGGTRRPPCDVEQIEGLTVHHRLFLYIPMILKSLDGYLYARGIESWFAKYLTSHEQPDLLDAHFMWPDGVGVSRLARRFHYPFVVTLRGTINPRLRKHLMRPQMAGALRAADAVISVSRAMADIAVALGARREKVHVIPNGVDTSLFRPVPREEARRLLALPSDVPLVVTVANMLPAKGHHDLLEAAAALPADVHLVFVGPAPNAAYLARLKAIVAQRGLTRRVHFMGKRSQQEVAACLNAADVHVLASYSEGCPNVVLESLACGTPVVGTTVGGIPDIVTTGRNGLLVPPGNPSALTGALRAALARQWSRKDLRQTVAHRSWKAVAEEVLAVFNTAARASQTERQQPHAERPTSRPPPTP